MKSRDTNHIRRHGADVVDYCKEHGPEATRKEIIRLGASTNLFIPNLRRPGSSISAALLMSAKLKSPPHIVQNILPIGLTGLLGKPKLGKSHMGHQLMQSITTGDKFLDHFEVNISGPVLGILLEEDEFLTSERYRQIGFQGNKDVHLCYASFNKYEASLEWVDNEVKIKGYKFVYIDPLQHFIASQSGSSEPGYAQVSNFLNALRQIAIKYQIGIMFVSHMKKEPTEDVFDGVLGSTAFVSVPEGLIAMKRAPRGKDYDAELWIRGRRLTENAFCLTKGESRWHYSRDLDEEKSDQERVISCLKDGNAKLDDIMNCLGKDRASTRSLLWRMSQKRLVELKGKHYHLKDVK